MRGGLLLLCVMAAGARAQDQTGNIRGTVVDSVTRLPVRKASVSVHGTMLSHPNAQGGSPQLAGRQPQPPSVVTDATGAFEFDELPAGQYQLMVQQASYPAAQFGAFVKSAVVVPGQTTQSTFELVPASAISGRILDEDGDPIETGCVVNLHAAGAGAGTPMNGRFVRGVENGGTYRIFNVVPGKYTATVECRGGAFQRRPLSAGPDPPPVAAYPLEYYPGVQTAESAEVLDLAPGSERSGVDFKMRPAAVTRVHVKLAGVEVANRRDLMWRLLPDSADTQGSILGGWTVVPPSKAAFDIDRVFPGSYSLIGFARSGASGAIEHIQAGDRPLDVVLRFQPPVELSGKVEVETPSASHPVDFSQVQVRVTSRYQIPMTMQQGQPKTNDDGSFLIKDIFPGPSVLRVAGVFGFLKTVWIGSTEVKDGKVDLSAGTPGPLRVVISQNTASVSGTAPAGMMVGVQAADPAAGNSTRAVTADANGNFKLDGMAPGKYRIGLMEQPGTLPADAAQEVSLGEGEVRTMDFKTATDGH